MWDFFAKIVSSGITWKFPYRAEPKSAILKGSWFVETTWLLADSA